MEYRGQTQYELNIAGLTRSLPIIEINPGKLWIASFVMLGDSELNYHCARNLIKKFPGMDFDYLIVPEAKAIALAESIGEALSKDYIVLRKSIKSYMKNPIIVNVKSITTAEDQKMVIDGRDAEKIKSKRVYLIDDVVSTGGSYRAMSKLVREVGAEIGFAGAVLREGDFDLSDIEEEIGLKIDYLQNLPLFEL